MSDRTPSPAEVEEALATELLRIHRDSYGTGAGLAKAYVHDDTVVVFLDDLQLQRSEEFLIGAGRPRPSSTSATTTSRRSRRRSAPPSSGRRAAASSPSSARRSSTPTTRSRSSGSRPGIGVMQVTDERAAREAAGHPTYTVAATISTAIVRLMSQYTGRGPTKARTSLNTNFALVVLEDTLTKGEHSLVSAGETEAVRDQRATFQSLMRAEATAAVEEVTGREVRVALSNFSPEDGVAVELFLFQPLPETDEAVVAEVAVDGDHR